MAVSDPLPVMTGGTIADGTYVLTTNISYAGHSADEKTRRRTVTFTGNELEVVNSDNGGSDAHVNFTFTTSGTDIIQMLACGSGKASTLGYTATATSFVSATKGADEGTIQTYVKQ